MNICNETFQTPCRKYNIRFLVNIAGMTECSPFKFTHRINRLPIRLNNTTKNIVLAKVPWNCRLHLVRVGCTKCIFVWTVTDIPMQVVKMMLCWFWIVTHADINVNSYCHLRKFHVTGMIILFWLHKWKPQAGFGGNGAFLCWLCQRKSFEDVPLWSCSDWF